MYVMPLKLRTTVEGSAASVSSQARVNVASAAPLMSPFSSITTAVPLRRTSASANSPGIGFSFQMEDELDRVVLVVGGDVHLVDHVLDQEQAPPARLLQACELRFDVGGI